MDTFLFDLDGTLLPMDQDKFVDVYFNGLAKKIAPYGIDPKKLIATVWEGTKAMINNDGAMSNCNRFWDTAGKIFGGSIDEYEKIFNDYYENEFQMLKEVTYPSPTVKECIRVLKDKGYKIVLATNPLFPKIATYSRINWAGLKPDDFEWITTYENSSYCKPNVKYYEEILHNLNLVPGQCIMIGNDVSDDMSAELIGMDTYLVTDCLINTQNKDISHYKKGTLEDLLDFIKDLPSIG
ncbi:phosphoglycolate phosphatase-like HAD superfamily hydrolase [Herbinix hemicellulosilytica]|uniref:Uncharacterized protein n=1 Tax=Herbinix hemicellulosilytica TaxID=1564487 RepID=A0A0H5SHA6_HERHM|nr:HAD family hydrolase [Herbinix hemicellulosilytica]RBP57698.1 phosphoglycolate phosphatase-like HAD superfamily hydrolase [Herbinix hemicellulosilytica]CRZ34181.1 hypothetical protein HHT355_0978 [Herbinix hemicellulosilytica]